MRNLKKILALVLALVMSLSLMATAGASQFPDVDEGNPYATAIDVLDELKVFQGFDDGTFKPTETLNRAQAAVLVYRIATGDVENKYLDNYTFMQQSKFTDLDGYNWAKGYINYCQNAGIVVGTSATTFDPGAKVTGYQLLVMLLRTLGYGKAGEFADPKGWELQTATIAERENITKNVTSGDFGAPAPRQMVAEILFRGLLTETVEYSALVPGGYTKSGETLGMREFGLEKVSGVVMANEWANINDGGDSVLAAGTTEMLVDGKSVTVNKGTELDAVGLTYNAYIANGEGSTKRALTLEAGDNTVAFNEGKATGPDTDYSENREWASIQKLADTESISIKDSTEFFVNYDQAWNEDVTSDYRISYAIAQKSIPSATDNEWNKYIKTLNADEGKKESDKTYPGHSISERTIKVNWDVNDDDVVDANDIVKCWYIAIRPDYLINEIDQDIMEEIFYSADRLGDNTDGTNTILQNYAIGEVYVGTTSMKDYSDTMSWKSFKTEYFNDTKTSRRFTSAENGESLRVIDNNNDGTAEYVLKIKYTMDQVTGTYKDAPELNGFRVAAKYKDNNLSMDGEFTVGDVVVYTVIDNKLTMWPAEVLTDSIKTKTFKNITVTTEGGEVKGQSGIENLTGMDQLIMNMNDKTQYNMYLDRFGFVRAYALAQGSKYALLTEMYPSSNQNHNYVQTGRVTAEMKMGEADIDEFNVTNKGGSVFFSGYAWTSRNTRYQNTDLNYLQPAIAHLGVANQYEGATKSALAPGSNAYTLTDWNRTVWEMITEYAATNSGSNTDYGVFDYDGESHSGYTDGRLGDNTVNNNFSFTNVAAYSVDDDNNVTLNTASKLFIDQNGEQVYYDSNNWTTKFTQSSYIAAAKKANSTLTDAQARADFQDLVNGTNKGGNNAGLTVRFYPVYAVDYVQLNREDVKAGMRHFTIPSDYTSNFNASNNGYVDATVNTEFYVVMPDNIIYKVGYDELPSIKAANVRAAYAVAKNTTAADNGRDYWVADVIVIEVSGLEHAFDSISLMYSNPFEMSSSVRWIDSLNNKWKVYQPDSDKLAEMQVVPSSVKNPNNPDGGWGNQAWYGNDYGFYGLKQVELQEEGELTAEVVELITKDYNKYGIYAGTVQRIKGILNSSGYIDVDLSGNPYNGTLVDYPNVKHITARNVPVYRIDGNSADGLTLSESDAYNEVYLGDQIIWVCEQGSADKFDKVAFIVDLGTRTKGVNADYNYTADQWLWDEYNAIILEQKGTPAVTTDVNIDIQLAANETAEFIQDDKTVVSFNTPGTHTATLKVSENAKTFNFDLKVKDTSDIVSIVPAATGWKTFAVESKTENGFTTYTIYMVKANIANSGVDARATVTEDAGTIYTEAVVVALAAEAATLAGKLNPGTPAEQAEAAEKLAELQKIDAGLLTIDGEEVEVDELAAQLDPTAVGSLANKATSLSTGLADAKTAAKAAVTEMVGIYTDAEKYPDVAAAAKALNEAIDACTVNAQLALIYTADALVTSNELVAALQAAVNAALINQGNEAAKKEVDDKIAAAQKAVDAMIVGLTADKTVVDAANNVKTLVGKCVPNGVAATADAAGTDISEWWTGTASSGSLVSGADTNANTKAVKALEDAITAAEATILASTKTNATATVTAYEKDAIAAMTAGTEKTAIETAKSTADSAIESADTVAAVNSAVATYKAAVDLNLAKYNAKADAAAYKGAGYDTLTPDQKTEADAAITALKSTFDRAVASASTTEAIATLLDDYKEDVDEAVATAKLTKLDTVTVTLNTTGLKVGNDLPTATVTEGANVSLEWKKNGTAFSGSTFDAATSGSDPVVAWTVVVTVTPAENYRIADNATVKVGSENLTENAGTWSATLTITVDAADAP